MGHVYTFNVCLVQRVYFLLVLLFLVSTAALTLSVLYEEGQSRIELQTKLPEDYAKISQSQRRPLLGPSSD